MCATCGCAGTETRVARMGDDPATHRHDHDHIEDHDHSHDCEHGSGTAESGATITLEQRVLAKNEHRAAENREWLRRRGVLMVNLMSSPGSGKTTLLERTVTALGDRIPITVIEGDQETWLDGQRVREAGCRAVQINTGAGCHLDADMVGSGLRRLDPPASSIVFVENVGNLVCPALFDLGESRRVVLVSTTEGADKPLKYPHMFRTADLVLLNKVDLLAYLDFDTADFEANARRVNPRLRLLRLSATRGHGVDTWCHVLAGDARAQAG